MNTFSKRCAAALTGVALLATLAACAPTVEGAAGTDEAGSADVTVGTYESSQDVADSFPTKDVCGTEPITLGFAIALANGWMRQIQAMMEKELAAAGCDNVTIVATDGQNDPQKSIADINSLVAQGVDGILTFPVFGAAEVPALRKAYEAGISVVTYITDGGAVVGQDISDSVTLDSSNQGKLFVDFANEAVGDGTVVFLGGAPGQPNSVATMDAIKTAIADHPGLSLVTEEFQPTNGNAAEVRSVMSGLLAKYGRIDAVMFDNGAVATPILQAYEAAGLEAPAIALSAGTNSMNCAWDSASTKFPYYSTDGQQSIGFIGMRKLLAAVNGVEDTEPNSIAPFTVVDTVAGKDPVCDPDASPDADWSTTLTVDEVNDLLK